MGFRCSVFQVSSSSRDICLLYCTDFLYYYLIGGTRGLGLNALGQSHNFGPLKLLARVLKRDFSGMRQIAAPIKSAPQFSHSSLPLFSSLSFSLFYSAPFASSHPLHSLSSIYLYIIPSDPTRPVSACYTGRHLIPLLLLIITLFPLRHGSAVGTYRTYQGPTIELLIMFVPVQ